MLPSLSRLFFLVYLFPVWMKLAGQTSETLNFHFPKLNRWKSRFIQRKPKATRRRLFFKKCQREQRGLNGAFNFRYVSPTGFSHPTAALQEVPPPRTRLGYGPAHSDCTISPLAMELSIKRPFTPPVCLGHPSKKGACCRICRFPGL